MKMPPSSNTWRHLSCGMVELGGATLWESPLPNNSLFSMAYSGVTKLHYVWNLEGDWKCAPKVYPLVSPQCMVQIADGGSSETVLKSCSKKSSGQSQTDGGQLFGLPLARLSASRQSAWEAWKLYTWQACRDHCDPRAIDRTQAIQFRTVCWRWDLCGFVSTSW